MDRIKFDELKELCNLELSILNNGKIEESSDGYFADEVENERLKVFYDLQQKYTYGWHIARQTLEEQIMSINEFKKYIIEH